MSTFHDYESWGLQTFRQTEPSALPEAKMRLNRERIALLEQYSGTSIVEWWHRIYGQLIKQEEEADKARNFTYVDKLRKFRLIWEENKIDGSINVEPLNVLYAAASMLGADNWNLASYFRNLATKLDVVIQSEQQLPRGADANSDQNEPMLGAGGGGGAGGGPPMAPAFGPDEEPPPGAEGGAGGGVPGMPGAPGAEDQGMPGEEGEIPPGEAPPGGLPPDETMPPPPQAQKAPQAGTMGGDAEEEEPVRI